MHHDIAMQKLIESLDIFRVTGGQPARNEGFGLLQPDCVSTLRQVPRQRRFWLYPLHRP
jgi:hypothetical protein